MSTPTQRPDFQAFAIRKRGDGQKDFWTEIGAGFLHKDGAGLNIVLQATPLDGRIVLRALGSEAE